MNSISDTPRSFRGGRKTDKFKIYVRAKLSAASRRVKLNGSDDSGICKIYEPDLNLQRTPSRKLKIIWKHFTQIERRAFKFTLELLKHF